MLYLHVYIYTLLFISRPRAFSALKSANKLQPGPSCFFGVMKPRLVAAKLLPFLLFLLVASLLFLLSPSVSPDWGDGGSWKAPLRLVDLLPLLPRRAAWPLLRSLRSAVDLLPTFVGSASSPEDDLVWGGACFYENTAWMEFHNKSQSQFGGGTLHIKVGGDFLYFF